MFILLRKEKKYIKMKPPQSFKTSFPPSLPGSTHLIFAGGGRPLSHAAWVMGHLDLTLYVSLIHSFVLSKKPIKQTSHKNVFCMLSNGIKKCVWQDWWLTGLHRSLNLWGSCERDKRDSEFSAVFSQFKLWMLNLSHGSSLRWMYEL